jgi:hypothetical protein
MIACAICGTTLPDVEDAIAAGWLPSFWVDEQEIGPACDRCSMTYLTLADDGEFEPQPQHSQVARCWVALHKGLL